MSERSGGEMRAEKESGSRVIRILDRLETGLITLAISILILMAFGQIVLRNLFSYSLLWADPFLRHMVLWVGLLGAALATRQGRHIRIDILPQLLPPRGRTLLLSFTELFSAGVCGYLFWIGARFVREEMDFGGTAFGAVPSWIAQLILPAAFALIALRFLVRAILAARAAWRNRPFGSPPAEDRQ